MKVGILGAGTVTSGSHLPVLVNMPGVSVDWICDRSITTAQAVAKPYRIKNVQTKLSECTDVDIVLVATPVGSRNTLIPDILSRGWHAFCEKPFALSLKDHDSYVAAAELHGLQIGVGQVRRYARPTATARKLLQSGFLGPVLRVGAAEGAGVHGTGRGSDWYMTDPSDGGGVLMETGSHLVDQVLFILGATDTSLIECTQRRHMGLELASSVLATIKTAQSESVMCCIELSMLDDLCNGIFIEFPNYLLKVGLFFNGELSLVSKDGIVLSDLVQTEGVSDPMQAFCLEWKDFIQQCQSNKPSIIDAATVRNTTALIEASYKRAQNLGGVNSEV